MKYLISFYWLVINSCLKCIKNNPDLLLVLFFIKNKERIQKFKETGDTSYIYKNELDNACFQHDIAHGHFKDLKRRTFSENVLRDKAFNIAKNPKYDGLQRGLASMVYTFFDKKSKVSGVNIEVKHNEQLAKELHKPIIRNFKKRAVYSGFKDNIWGADLADVELISKFNTGFKFLSDVIDIFSKYACVVPLKDKKGVNIVNAFPKILNDSNRKPNKIWVDKGSEFYNNSFKKWLKDNDNEMYRIHDKRKFVVAARFIKTLKTKMYKCMTSVSKNAYVDKLDDMVSEYNNIYNRTTKMKPVVVKDNTYVHFKKKVIDEDPKFKVGDHVRISRYKNIFAEGYTPNWSEKVFISSKIKNTVPWINVINDLNDEEIIVTFYEKELQKTDQKEFRTRKNN